MGVVRRFYAALGVASNQLGLEADTARGGSVIRPWTSEGTFQTGIPVNQSDASESNQVVDVLGEASEERASH